ncbi:MAG: hypothetical protein KBA70_00030 [Aquabacterium sp.]|uniref:hypothetical protein n=1 Tax=Aquabacterium sp. TaxID=1872578 RepID=UPI001B561570|nr:hypothetical protein [Aquabacterium sp.]MBP7131141.1 hypothetical protein [Aquabacterium sp.]
MLPMICCVDTVTAKVSTNFNSAASASTRREVENHWLIGALRGHEKSRQDCIWRLL